MFDGYRGAKVKYVLRSYHRTCRPHMPFKIHPVLLVELCQLFGQELLLPIYDKLPGTIVLLEESSHLQPKLAEVIVMVR